MLPDITAIIGHFGKALFGHGWAKLNQTSLYGASDEQMEFPDR
jgi:hypothetical protein